MLRERGGQPGNGCSQAVQATRIAGAPIETGGRRADGPNGQTVISRGRGTARPRRDCARPSRDRCQRVCSSVSATSNASPISSIRCGGQASGKRHLLERARRVLVLRGRAHRRGPLGSRSKAMLARNVNQPGPPGGRARKLCALTAMTCSTRSPSHGFEKITTPVKSILDVPSRPPSPSWRGGAQWVQSRSKGLDARETSAQAISFCTLHHPRRDCMLVNDACEDPRFAQNPLVVGSPSSVLRRCPARDVPKGNNVVPVRH